MSETLPSYLPLDKLQRNIGSAPRWEILRELADGESLLLSELRQRTKNSSSTLSKLLSSMVADGVLQNPRGRLYEIPPRFVADKANRIIDFGWCVLRPQPPEEKTS